ncbi:hypothetical protein OHB39_34745 [Streptomyces sp. NBC_00047]|uniref:hypothetical protein n=1 Tax=Streptomyces sp. NBC_00047 TaxID=2975627 RepID=UPI00225086ED|nr:hypothetical protein [Streptomyces sp. NBC_00047]MCX5612672.1 hypothetical protein [Streptomyces sp. NBC_00047]
MAAVARSADVSRTFLYDNPEARRGEARTAIAAAMAQAGEHRSQILADQLTQRTRIGELLGEVRYLQAEWADEAIQRDLIPSGYDPQMSVARAILVLRRRPGTAARGERHG